MIQELKDPVLRWFGAVLAILHLLTIIFYLQYSVLEIASSSLPVCWPFFPNCFENSPWSPAFTSSYLAAYGMAAMASLYFFVSKKTNLAWTLGVAAFALKLGLHLKDYRMMGNYHYMLNIILFLFLFYPRKRQILPLMIVGFYLAAGSLKFNKEWISGAALLEEPLIKGWLLVAMCTYVVFLEMIVSFGLLSKRTRIFWFSILQFLIFHLYSYGQVGWFYPAIMIGLLSIFYLPRLLKSGDVQFAKERKAILIAPLAIFALAQCAPLYFKGESALTGQGRLFSLNMFDARTECLITEVARFNTLSVETDLKFTYMRIRCDPVSVIGYERARCAELQKTKPDFKDLDVHLHAKKKTGSARPILRIENFCETNPTFSIWTKNDYILRLKNPPRTP